MTQTTEHLLAALDERVAAMVSACTRCGKCVEACPMPRPANVDVADPEQIISGVIDILDGGEGRETSRRWATMCSGSGFCIGACEAEVNPRFLLTMARTALSKQIPVRDRRTLGRALFKGMSRGVRIPCRGFSSHGPYSSG